MLGTVPYFSESGKPFVMGQSAQGRLASFLFFLIFYISCPFYHGKKVGMGFTAEYCSSLGGHGYNSRIFAARHYYKWNIVITVVLSQFFQ